ncbi:MAG: HDOD domain-containing protein, partial [Phycisphaerales bacterium]|nr:HDOD domain-containing protein [Phycisphaerales bacterium]
MSLPSLDAVLSSPNLPTLPAVAWRVLELTRRPDVRLSEIADVVQNDPAITARILKTVNSS